MAWSSNSVLYLGSKSELAVGINVLQRLPKKRCEGLAGPRSFNVRVGETTYRRNRRHMWKTNEEPSEFLENNVDTDASIDEPFISDTKSTVTDMAGQKNPEAIVTDVMEKSNESISPTVDHNNPRRSNRVRKQTQFFVSA